MLLLSAHAGCLYDPSLHFRTDSRLPLAAPSFRQSSRTVRPIVRAKVRDIFDAGDRLLIVASDRISAFDYVLGSGIADKGKILTQLSAFWFAQTASIVPNHLISTDAADFPVESPEDHAMLAGRTMLVRRAELPIECVARGYLSGSGWKDYLRTGSVCGIDLPPDWSNPTNSPRRSSRQRPRRKKQDTTSTSRRRRQQRSPARRSWRGRATHASALLPRRGPGRFARNHRRRHQIRVRPASPG